MPPTDPPERPSCRSCRPSASRRSSLPAACGRAAGGRAGCGRAAAGRPGGGRRGRAPRGPQTGATGAAPAGADAGRRPARRERLAHRGRPALLDGRARARRRRARARLRGAADGARDAQDRLQRPAGHEARRLARAHRRARPRQPRAPARPAARARPGRDGPGDADEIDVAIVVPPTTVTPKPDADADAEAGGEARRHEAARQARVHPEEEAAAVGRRGLPRDHARLLDRPRGGRRAP